MTKQTHNIARNLTIRYALIQASFWMGYMSIRGFTAVYLADMGLSYSLIGVLMAIASVLSIVLQSVLGSIADRGGRLSLRYMTGGLVGASLLFAGLLMISGWISYSNQLVLGIIFTLMLGVLYALQPFLTSLCYEFINHGIDVNFGLARGIGSICCSFVSATVGYLILLFGSDCILWCLFLMFVLLFILVITFTVSGRHKHTHSPIRFRPHAFERRRSTSESGKESGALDFMRRNKTYTIFLLGCCLFMTAYQSINSYLINIATNVGGDSSTVGVTLGIAAAVELPVMACFSFIMKRFSCTRLLRFSSFFYILKAAGMLIAANPAMIYMAALMQMGSFAVFLPASTHFANIAVAPHDRVKAQALLSASTVGLSMTIGSLFGGTIIDQLGVRFLLLFCVIIAAMGFLLTCYVTKKVEKTQEAAL